MIASAPRVAYHYLRIPQTDKGINLVNAGVLYYHYWHI